MGSIIAVLDTNVFLHYAPIDQIKWPDFLKADRITLVVTQTVLRQLADKKDSPGNRKIRERAGAALKRLEGLAGQSTPLTVRDGVELEFVFHDAELDFSVHRLSRHIADDWIIASILELRGNSQLNEIVLVTHDLGLKLKARTLQIESVSVPEIYKLPDDLDEEQRRIKELEAELRTLKFQMPALRLIFEEETDVEKFVLRAIPKTSAENASKEMEELRARFPKLDTKVQVAGTDILNAPGVAAIEAYNNRLQVFLNRYEQYIQDRDQFAQSQARLIQLEIRLSNTGNSPASDIDIVMHFPDGFTLFDDEEQLPSAPPEPAPPGPPLSALEESLKAMQGFSISQALASQISTLTNFDFNARVMPRNVSHPRIRKTNSYEVKSHVQSLKHNFIVSLGRFFVIFDSWETARSFSIAYTLYASNLPTTVEGSLHVVVQT